MKKLLKWGGIAFLVLIVIGAIASNGSKTSNTSTSQSDTQTTQTANNTQQNAANAVVGLNQPATSDDLTFTVTNVSKAKTLGSQYTKKDAQGMFYIVTVKIENTGKKTVTFDSSMAKVVDNEDREFERSIDGQTAKGMSEGKVDLFLQQIQPSLSLTGDLVFDLPANISQPQLLVKGGLFSKGAKINLE